MLEIRECGTLASCTLASEVLLVNTGGKETFLTCPVRVSWCSPPNRPARTEPGWEVFSIVDRVGADHDPGYRDETGRRYPYVACDVREDLELERG